LPREASSALIALFLIAHARIEEKRGEEKRKHSFLFSFQIPVI
jgi:hypothetical protein